MTDLIMPRRKFLTGLFGLVAAPAVVKASSLMPVKVMPTEEHLIMAANESYVWNYQHALAESFRRTQEEMLATMADNLFGRTYS